MGATAALSFLERKRRLGQRIQLRVGQPHRAVLFHFGHELVGDNFEREHFLLADAEQIVVESRAFNDGFGRTFHARGVVHEHRRVAGAGANRALAGLHRGLHLLVVQQPLDQKLPGILLAALLGRTGQHEPRLDLQQLGRHGHEFRRDFQVQLLHELQVIHVLPGDLSHGQVQEIQLLLMNEVQQQIQRSFKSREVERQTAKLRLKTLGWLEGLRNLRHRRRFCHRFRDFHGGFGHDSILAGAKGSSIVKEKPVQPRMNTNELG